MLENPAQSIAVSSGSHWSFSICCLGAAVKASSAACDGSIAESSKALRLNCCWCINFVDDPPVSGVSCHRDALTSG